MKELYAQIWSPVDSVLAKEKTVFIVPDGILHRLPFAALLPPHASDWQDCLDSRYHIQQLTGSKQLLQRRRQVALEGLPARGLLLVANPWFSEGQDAATARSGGWEPLPGTEIEMQRISDLCDSLGIDVTVLHAETATEKNLKSEAALSPRMIHLATHGFFLPRREQPESNAGTFDQRRGKTYLASEQHPLLRSGLLLAHANAAWTGQPGPGSGDDGILTALEVAHLPLEKTELVVLSACETALGDIQRGEGVFGLQRAFFSAGATSLIMSLWVIPDQLTADFMQQFYRDWLSGMTKAEALRQARKHMRERIPDPRFWAPFIIIGP